MRVLSILVGATTRAGGVGAFVGGAARALGELGHEMPVLSTDLALAPHGYWQPDQRRAGQGELHRDLAAGDVRVLPARFPRRLAYSPALRRALEEEVPRADVVHVHNLWQYPQYAASRRARSAGVPYVVSPHGALDGYLRSKGRGRKALTSALWQRRMLEEATVLHVTTADELEAIADAAPAVTRAVVPCGISVADFAALPTSTAFRLRHLDGFEGPLVTFIGRVTAKKGLDVLIGAFARVRASRDCRLAIVGPDDEGLTPSLQALAAGLGLQSDVRFLGPRYGDERLELLASTDVWALPSHTENFGIAVVEAMAAGCPVLVSPGVSLASEVAAADAGVVAEPVPESFAPALLALLDDDDERERLGRAAIEFARRYDWDVIAPRLVSLYETALDRRRVAS